MKRKTKIFRGPGAQRRANDYALEHGGISRPATPAEVGGVHRDRSGGETWAVDTGAINPLERDDVRRVLDMITVRNANGDEIAHYGVCYLVLAHALDQTEAPSDLYIDWELSSSRTRVEGNYNRISAEDKQTIWDAAIRATSANDDQGCL